MNKTLKKIAVAAIVFGPMLAMAAAGDNILETVVVKIATVVKLLGPILFGLISAFFLYGVILFIVAGQDEKKRTAAKGTIIYAVIGMAVAVLIWGLVGVLAGFFNVDETATRPTPTLPGVNVQ